MKFLTRNFAIVLQINIFCKELYFNAGTERTNSKRNNVRLWATSDYFK